MAAVDVSDGVRDSSLDNCDCRLMAATDDTVHSHFAPAESEDEAVAVACCGGEYV